MTMSKKLYVVQRGDTLQLIAIKHGFRRWQDLYFHKANKGFRKRRRNPSRIFPTDVIVIPSRHRPDPAPAAPAKAPPTPAPDWSISPDVDPSVVPVPSLEDLQVLQPWRLPHVGFLMLALPAREVARALRDLNIPVIDQKSKLDDLAKTIKGYMELETTNWLIQPDLRTIGEGLLDLIQNTDKLGQPNPAPEHPIVTTVRGK
jgi:hypothetical protein